MTTQWQQAPPTSRLAQVPFLAQPSASPHTNPALPPVVSQPAPVALTNAEMNRTLRALRGDVAKRMREQTAGRSLDRTSREEAGRALIQAVLVDHADTLVDQHRPPLGDATRTHLAQRLFDAIFRLGPLQPFVDLPGATDIEIYGHERVLVLFADGRAQWYGPIAESDDELVEFLQLLASRDAHNERAFTPSHPHLEMALPGRGRLAAVGFAPTQGRVRVTIRLQHLKNVDLAMLREQDEIDTVLERFLTAAVAARKSIIVSGLGQGSGKTTFLRGLCAAIPPHESIATAEDTYELYLQDDPARHHRVLAQQAFAGAGETDATGRTVGQIPINRLMKTSLRHNISRIVVGEVREPTELLAMFDAMQMGNGSMSTIHADSARDVVERLVGLAVRDANEAYAYRQIAATIDLIVFLGVETNPDGSKTRYVREVVEPSRGEPGQPVAVTDVFLPGPGGRAVPNVAPSFLPDLVAAGFDPHLLTAAASTWRAR